MANSSNTLTSKKLAQRVVVERARLDADLDRMTRAHSKLWRAEQALERRSDRRPVAPDANGRPRSLEAAGPSGRDDGPLGQAA